MLRLQAIIFLASLVLTLYTFIECARRDESKIKKLPKWGWLVVILFFSTFGSIAYLVIGRNRGNRGPKPPKRRVLPPDDDPDFLRGL